ncbi:MAG TPA: hypothetical protein VMS60_03145 [Solirubrobacterales bacterium]|nr:hypothetical protein [Solirubrobacterales bacterium]
MTEFVAFLLPALPLLALLLTLLLGHYPGCEAIVRLSERIAAGRRQGTGASRRPRTPRAPFFARGGGLLLALSLSGRAPPAAA